MNKPTRAEVETACSSRRLDYWVAIFVMGYHRDDLGRWVEPGVIRLGDCLEGTPPPAYSLGDKTDAVVRRMCSEGWVYVLELSSTAKVQFRTAGFVAEAESAVHPVAVCRAALIATLFHPEAGA